MFKKLVFIGLVITIPLVGCKANEPSNADIQKQLLAELSPCPEISIQDFQKINAYPQQDGSYVEQLQYNLVFTPSQTMLNYVSDWDTQLSMIKSSASADETQANIIKADATKMYVKCVSDEQINPNGPDCGVIQADFLRNSNNGPVFQRINTLNHQANVVLNKDLGGLQSEINRDCPIIVIGGVLGLFGGDKYNVDAYGKTYTLTEQGTAHFVQSDNGWVIQN